MSCQGVGRLNECSLPALRTMVVMAVLLWAVGARGQEVMPDPAFGPEDVVRIQLEALRSNGADDGGIAVAFRFASPSNKRSTGPLARFARMIKLGPYAPMLSFTDAVYAPVQLQGRRALQDVTLIAPGESPVRYRFHLSRQEEDGPLDECWMTDAVQVLSASATQA